VAIDQRAASRIGRWRRTDSIPSLESEIARPRLLTAARFLLALITRRGNGGQAAALGQRIGRLDKYADAPFYTGFDGDAADNAEKRDLKIRISGLRSIIFNLHWAA
jgi:hypothetical protein